jgi:O-acetyl-ADP-ribose deacetylase (regulator of RNase III)
MPGFQITVQVGNIINQPDCDAIVNSANKNLRAGSGVCGAIYRAAGAELEPCSVQFAPLGIGKAVATPGFLLPNPWIIHVRGPKYHFDPEPAANLQSAMESLLQVAEECRVRRLAVPAISMGVYSYPPEDAIPILVETTRKFLPQVRSLEEVRFVVMGDALAHLFAVTIAA